MLYQNKSNTPYDLTFQLNKSKYIINNNILESKTPNAHIHLEESNGWINVYEEEPYDRYFQRINSKGEKL